MAAVQDQRIMPSSAMRPLALLLVAGFLAGAPVMAADVPTTVRLAWVDPPEQLPRVTLQARSAREAVPPVEISLHGNEVSLALSAGPWFLHASSPGYWSDPVVVTTGGHAVETTLTLYRAASIRAEVKVPRPGNAQAVDVYFTPVEQASALPRGSTVCPITDGRLECDVPSGLYDLTFRIPGHASLHRWAADLSATRVVQIGDLAFRIGATISGRIAVNGAEDAVPFERVRVGLRNSVSGDRNEALRGRTNAASEVVHPNARGYFSFDVLPGSYVVSASAPGFMSEERQVTVIEGREVVLERALTLERLWKLSVNVGLPPEGRNQPWEVAVTRFDADGNASAQRIMSVPADGVCTFGAQLSGPHGVELRLRDSTWASQSTFLDHDTTIEMPVHVTRVHGMVQVGEDPLQGRLLFRSPDHGFRIPVQAHADGTFLVFLPEVPGDRWEQVEVQSSDLRVKRVLEDVMLERDPDGYGSVTLRLPTAAIGGIVVDDGGRPVRDGLINVSAPDGFQQFTTSDGTFKLNGLERGRYALTAAARDLESEEPLLVDIDEEEGRHDVVLKVMRTSNRRGSVASASGPVIGASVFVAATTDLHGVVIPIPVDVTGAFEFRVPPRAADVTVAVTAPGFAFRFMRAPVPAESLDLLVDQNGGALEVDGRLGSRAQPHRPFLIHNGAILPAFVVGYLAQGRLHANPDERVHFEIASAEEGTYMLCLLSQDEEQAVRLGAWPPASRCASGLLPRHGSLVLRAPEIDLE